ncbi:hypothetical protein [Massilimicrobiota sp. An142]|uniref:hypothetical protein n=1 Tax=Massilimicrobiota sp. An142 TaxID=1965564 RepID=UPI0013022517|nr:hypothetical protein [Massilimicrobiota sp. An142]
MTAKEMGQTSIKIPNWKSLYNPNLLMNSDYRSGIINQKGITSLDKSDGSTELGIDGWILYGINIAVGSNYVTFANRTSANHTVQQPLDIKGLKAGDKVTFYASCFNITGNVYIYMTGLDAQKKKLINGDNEFTFTLTSALERFYIELAPNAVVSFNCKKLEIGEHFTGMPAWNYVLEFAKCWNRFRAYRGTKDNVITITISDKNGTFILPFDVKDMVKRPTVTKNDIWTVSGGVYAEADTHSVYDNSVIFHCTTKEAILQVYFNTNDSYIYVDAYDY